MHLALLCYENWTASLWFDDTCPLKASCKFFIKKSLYYSSSDIKVPPIIINSTLSTSWPIFFNCYTLSLVCIYGLYLALIALIDVG